MELSVKVKPTKNKPAFGRDLTIYDYANSSKCTNRASKQISKITIAEIVQESEPSSEDLEHAEEGRAGKKCVIGDVARIVYNDYHIDVWFLVSQFIPPEDVCRFALICRKTAEVVQSGRFWTQLYRSCYDRSIDIPPRFQPENMMRLRGLRSTVIQSLYYIYPPFKNRLATASYRNPYRVVGRQLLSTWHKRTKHCWTYYFRLKASFMPESRPVQSLKLQREKNSLQFMQDIYMNPEEGCQIMMIKSDFLKVIPMYNEMLFVKNLTQTLSQSMIRYKVRLELGNYCGKRINELVFDPVHSVIVLDWWDPEYYKELGSTTQEENLSSEREWTEALEWDD
ncbi:transmembrane protein 183 [Anopheles nili]|uniref:transmembrane protein 183 n=1 Tax=Anopheles nili TaxID=185578 RepID=UPI00237B3241|nr:transmembrane protein 183 [Anopheles nili]